MEPSLAELSASFPKIYLQIFQQYSIISIYIRNYYCYVFSHTFFKARVPWIMMRWKDMEPWQKRKIILWFSFFIAIALLYISYVIFSMQQDRKRADLVWAHILDSDEEATVEAAKYDTQATVVTVGTYVENIKNVSMKNNSFDATFIVWYRWINNDELDFTERTGVYSAQTNSTQVLRDFHEDGTHYQQMRLNVTCTQLFHTKRFPLDSHNLKFDLQSLYPIDEVVFIPDTANSGVNPNLNITGYELTKHAIGYDIFKFPNSQNNPRLTEGLYSPIIATCLQITRSSWGLYLRCFVALIGALTWVMISVYICANHKVNPLGTLASALFGSISNIILGANLLPDVLSLGLVEFVNFFGTMIIIGGALLIIQMNHIREHYEEHLDDNVRASKRFAKSFGTVMFITLLTLCLLGNIIIPLTTYIWS